MSVALKIDVDTYRGLAEGAGRLADFLHAKKWPASFFVTLGPDTSGLAATRVFRHRGFMKKMQRTSALSVYGCRTALSGTLLPARPMALSFREELRRWQAWGFEISPHGYDHIRWHDQAAQWTVAEAARAWAAIQETYAHIFGRPPQSFAAQGWQAGAGTWQALDNQGLLYHSDSRGAEPYFPLIGAQPLQTLEIPTTLPTWDEMLAWDAMSPAQLAQATQRQILPGRLNVWTIHAEFEGGPYFELFKKTSEELEKRGETWDDLREVARRSLNHRQTVPACAFMQAAMPGRAGTVTCQDRDVIGRRE